jgi:lipoprotein NlpD
LRKEMPPNPGISPLLQIRKLIGFLLIGLTILSCVGYPLRSERPRGIYHRVKGGETLSAIARAYRVNLQDLAEINNISNPDQIEADSVIFVPDANQVLDDVMTAARSQRPMITAPVEPPPERAKPIVEAKAPPAEIPAKKPAAEAVQKREEAPVVSTPKERPAPPRPAERPVPPHMAERPAAPRVEERATPPPAIPERPEGVKIESPPARPAEGKKEEIHFDRKRFIWPVKGKVISPFGIQPNRMYFNGIRIAAAEGTAVVAAAGGLVIFSQPLKDYGETIIIKHNDQYATVYTQLGVRTVREETRVTQGDRIAFLGKGDGGGDSSLQFEIRHRNKARNPLFFLP